MLAIFFPFTTLLNSRSISINTERDGECKLPKCKGDKIRIRTTCMIFKVENVHTQAKRFYATPIPEKAIKANEAN